MTRRKLDSQSARTSEINVSSETSHLNRMEAIMIIASNCLSAKKNSI